MNREKLTSKERAKLRSQAHGMKPVVHIGAGGATAPVVESVREAFNNRELVKIRILETAPKEVRDTVDQVRDAVDGSEVVQMIGRVAVLYRPAPEDGEA